MKTQSFNRIPLWAFIVVVLSVGLFNTGSLAGPPTKLTFDKYEVVTDSVRRQTVLTGFIFGGAFAELAVVSGDKNKGRRLRIYTVSDDNWMLKIDSTLREEVLFVDVANINGRDRLITYEFGRLNWFDPGTTTERMLVSVTSNFDPPRENEIPHVDVTHDLNDDGRDDLVVPDIDGFWVFIQMDGGAFADPIKLGPSTDMSRIYGADGYRYAPWSQSRIHAIDYNHDSRNDLVFWNDDHFEVHIQDERRLFAAKAMTFTTDVAFDSDDLSSLATSDMTGRVLHSLCDLNDDGVGDLVVSTLEGKSISKKRSTYEVYFGKPTSDGGTVFESEAGATFKSDGRIQLKTAREDFDGDGSIDLMFTTINRKSLKGSIWKSIKGLMGDDIGLNLEFYQMKDGLFPEEPNVIHGIALDGVPSHREPGSVPLDIVLRGATHEKRKIQKQWQKAFNRTLLIGDVTGDGRADLLIEPEFRELNVFIGVLGPSIFSRQPQYVAVILPHDEEYTWLVDLNKDAKQDILMHHPFTLRDIHGGRKQPAGTEPHRIIVLIAR